MSEGGPAPVQDPDGPAARAGMTLDEYEGRVWDMAKSVVHVPAMYAVAQVVGLTKLVAHPIFQQPQIGAWREAGAFLCSFLGAWAVFYSTLLRDAGLRSAAATVAVPVAAVTAVLIWVALPAATEMTAEQAWWAAGLLVGPGPLAWLVTMRRWRVEKRRAAPLLEGTRPW